MAVEGTTIEAVALDDVLDGERGAQAALQGLALRGVVLAVPVTGDLGVELGDPCRIDGPPRLHDLVGVNRDRRDAGRRPQRFVVDIDVQVALDRPTDPAQAAATNPRGGGHHFELPADARDDGLIVHATADEPEGPPGPSQHVRQHRPADRGALRGDAAMVEVATHEDGLVDRPDHERDIRDGVERGQGRGRRHRHRDEHEDRIGRGPRQLGAEVAPLLDRGEVGHDDRVDEVVEDAGDRSRHR